MYKVAHLTSVHTPFDTRILHKECQTLARAGYDVVLIAPHERDVVVGKVRIRAVPRPRGRLERMLRTCWRIYRAALDEDAALYHFHDPELVPQALLLKLRGKPAIYDVHEDLPRQLYHKHWVPKRLLRMVAGFAEIIESIGARFFDGVVAATPQIAARFPPNKTTIVQNYPIPGELAPAGSVPYAERPPLVVYVGGITALRGAREMVTAMSLLPRELGARLALAGTFTPSALEKEVAAWPGAERTDLLGWQDRQQVAALLARARVGLVVLHPAPNHVDAHPTKLFEYMSAGVPVVTSDFPQWRHVVESERCGLLADPLDPVDIARSIQWLLEHPMEADAMGRRGREAVRTRYNWNLESQKLLPLYEELLK